MKKEPRIVVVIPTRDRADTLRFSIESVLRNDYSNLRVIVSNNCSFDDTADLVEAIPDPRVDLITTPSRISMSENFEFAIQHVIKTEPEDAFLLICGDDDGLLPGGLTRFAEIVASFPDHEAFTWEMQSYRWPSVSDSLEPNILLLRFGLAQAEVVRSEERFEKFAAGEINYERIVRIYHGLVRVSSLKRLQDGGRLIHSPIPDVYLGAALTCILDEFVEIPFPISIAGMSGHSNGVFQIRGGKPRSKKTTAGDFFKDSNLTVHPSVKVMPRSVRSCEFETLQHLRDLGLWSGQVNPVTEFPIMLKEAVKLPDDQRDAVFQAVDQIAAYFGWGEQLGEAKSQINEDSPDMPKTESDDSPIMLKRRRGFCKIDGDPFALRTIVDASIVASFALEVFREDREELVEAVNVGQPEFSKYQSKKKAAAKKAAAKKAAAKKSWFRRLRRTFRGGRRSDRSARDSTLESND